MTKHYRSGLTLLVALLAAGCSLADSPSFDTPRQLSAFAGWKGAAPKTANSFSFVVLSDHSSSQIPGQWEAAMGQVNLLQPHFVMSIGDIIPGYMRDEAGVIEQWKEVEAIHTMLDAPFFYCLGNHDATNPLMRRIYTERHGVDGRAYYSFSYRGCHFIVLDSLALCTSIPQMEEQLQWLAHDLAAAKDARHIFVFYHHLWNATEVAPRIGKLLPKEKTTIFSGHTHHTGFRRIDGVPNYVLSPTAAKPDADDVRTFALVNVNDARPTIALVTMNSLLPSDYSEFHGGIDELMAGVRDATVPAEGGSYRFAATNPLKIPVQLKLSWQAKGWKITPAGSDVTLAPGEKADQTFTLVPGPDVTGWPELRAVGKMNNPYLNRDIEVERTAAIGARLQGTAPTNARIVLDGDLADWQDVGPLALDKSDRIFSGREHWTGPADASCAYRAASDGENLYVAIEVRDDDLRPTAADRAKASDAVELFWDARPEAMHDQWRVLRGGHVSFILPADGDQPRIEWDMQGRLIPQDVKAVCKRRDGGWTIETSIPLRELGMPDVPPAPGRAIYLGVILNDRDGDDGKPTITRMSGSGMANEMESTLGYGRWVFGP